MIDIVEISKDSFMVYIGEQDQDITNMSLAIKDESTNLVGENDELAAKLGKRFQKQFIVCNHVKDPSVDIEVFLKVKELLS